MNKQLPWTVKAEPGRRRFNEETGEPLEPKTYYWVKDSSGSTIELFMGDSKKEELALLLAAAPEMLEALKAAETMLVIEGHTTRNPMTPDTPILRQIREAIARAEGR